MSTGQGPGTVDSFNQATLDRYFTVMHDLGMGVVRVGYGAANLDAVVAAAQAHGIDVQICFANSFDPAAVADASARYLPRGVVKYEGFNEPNIRNVTPAAYLAGNNACYAAAKKASAHTVWVSGALCPYGRYPAADAGKVDPISYLEQTLTLGVLQLDRFGFHPYGYWDNYTAAQMLDLASPYNGWAQMNDLARNIRQTFTAHSQPAPTIDATEWGAPTTTIPHGTSERAQADLFAQGLAWWRQQPWAGDVFIHSLVDNAQAGPADNPEWHFGVLRADWSEKPAAASLRAAVS